MTLGKVTPADKLLNLIQTFRRQLDLVEQEVFAAMPPQDPAEPMKEFHDPHTGRVRPIRARKIHTPRSRRAAR